MDYLDSQLLASQRYLLRDMVEWEVPVSDLRSGTYKLVSTIAIMEASSLIATSQIDEFGVDNVRDNVRMMRERASETSLPHRWAMLLVYEEAVLVSVFKLHNRSARLIRDRALI